MEGPHLYVAPLQPLVGGGSGYRLYSDTTYRTWTLSPVLCHGAKRLPNEISLGGCKSYNMRLALLTSQTR